MTANTIIVVALLGLVIFHLYHITQQVEKDAYKWWYMPWFSLVFTGLAYLLYNKTNLPDSSFLQKIFPQEFQLEAAYSLLCIAIWSLLQLLLRSDDIHEALIGPFRKLFAKGRDDQNQVLPFPYFIDHNQVVRAKVGKVFYRWTMKAFILSLAAVYAIWFILLMTDVLHEFYLTSGFGILGLLPLIDYYVYLCSEVPAEKESIDAPPSGPSDFDLLWKLYVNTFDNYSVAWRRSKSPKELTDTRDWGKDNRDEFDNLRRSLTDKSKRYNGIIEGVDILTALRELEPVFDHVENNGRHILIALDIPNHFKKDEQKSFVGEIADKLTETLKKSFTLYDRKSSQATLYNSIVIAPLSLLSLQGMDEDWLKKIGLITVIDFCDKVVSNMYECRKFCYILQSVNKDYQVVFISPHRRDIEPSLKNTWLTGSNLTEKRFRRFARGERLYFIGYHFEDFRERIGKIYAAAPNEPLYSGSEMVPIALSSRIQDLEKTATPIHFQELAYSNAIENIEEVSKFYDLIGKDITVSKKNLNEGIHKHLLPVDEILGGQVFSVVYDVENNAPAIYKKWMHLGLDENFTIVISKPYLFRDYFNSNHDYFVSAQFDALQPHLCKSRLTLAIILLNMLQKAEMDERRLHDLLVHYYDGERINSVSSTLIDLFRTYFSSELGERLMTTDQIVFDGEKYTHQIKYNLSQLTDSYNPEYLDIISVKDESGNTLLELPYDLMYQNFDKEQIHAFSGKPYRVKDFNKTTRTLNVSSANNCTNDILFYKATQTVSIVKPDNRTPIDGKNTGALKWHHKVTDEVISIQFEGFETEVRVRTKQWFEFYRYTVNGCGFFDSSAPERHYPKGKVLKITFSFMQKPRYLEKIDDIRKALQLLLYEAMQSVFPHQAQYLIIATQGGGDDQLPWIFNEFICHDPVRKGQLSFYFIEDAHIDLGLIGALTVNKENIRYILQYIYDYLIWLTEVDYQVEDNQPEGYTDYRQGKKNDRFSFLRYGREEVPDYLKDIDLLINFIKDLFQDGNELNKTNKDRQARHHVIGACDFCGKKMKNSEMDRLDDGRMRCKECGEDAIDTDIQFQALCEKVKQAFLKHLGINFSAIPHRAKLVSAVDLHKAHGFQFNITNGYDARKLLGLAQDTSGVDSLFVENGYKTDKTFGIIAHEMTHIWEYQDEDFQKVRKNNEDLVEGLAVWTDLFLSEKNGVSNIEQLRASWLARTDEYGRGLRFIMDHCPDDPYEYIRTEASKL